MKKNVFLFAGQGSQFYHMGESLYKENVVFRDSMEQIDDYIYRLTGTHMLEFLYDSKRSRQESFDQIMYTHPCIFMTEYSIAQVLMHYGVKPDYVLGTSLGELVALCVADAISVEDAAIATVRQAQCFQDTCENGGMLAILESYHLFDTMPDVFEHTQLAGVNFDGHFVVAGLDADIKRIERILRDKQITCVRLPVTYGFHSSYIDPARQRYMELVEGIVIKKPKIKIISSVTGAELTKFSKDYFWNVARKPIMYQKAIGHMEKEGEYNYIDLSIGGGLAGFAKRIVRKKSKSEIYTVETPFVSASENLPRLIKQLETDKKGKEDKKMLAYVFPGQGSQKVGMGEELFKEFPEYVKKADEILGYSIEELCLKDPDGLLNQTRYTQPAIFVVNALEYLKKTKETNMKPSYVAGHSLGEYNALFASGAFDFETGLRLVKKRGELMQQATGGSMAAIVQSDLNEVKRLIKEYVPELELANLNCPSQTVVSGRKEDIDRAEEIFMNNMSCSYIKLKVSGAFHSKYMTKASMVFADFIKDIAFHKMEIPVISNYTARPYTYDTLKENLVLQINHPVNWTESIRFIMGRGNVTVQQCGFGKVLTNLQKKLESETTPNYEPYEYDINCGYLDSKSSDVNDKVAMKDVMGAKVESDVAKELTGEKLGNQGLKDLYHLNYAYMVGGMYRGITSKDMVVALAKKGMFGFLGTGGMTLSEVEEQIDYIQRKLCHGESYGVNVVHALGKEEREEAFITTLLNRQVHYIEVGAYMSISTALVRYKVNGLIEENGQIKSNNVIMAKLSRPEVAEEFLSPAPEAILQKLYEEDKITKRQLELARKVPVADVICVESDSGGHTNQAVALATFPAICMVRDRMQMKYGYEKPVYVGAAGGIGAPAAAAAMFVMGADFILTGSMNQCTVESGMCDAVKDMLQHVNVQDTDYAPAGDMFELNAKVQVLKKGVFFSARANKLHEIYDFYDSLDQIDKDTRHKLETRYFGKTFEEVLDEVRRHYAGREDKLNMTEKQKMASVFKWYLNHCSNIALAGNMKEKVNFQVHCGPAMGVFNQWVKGTELEDWRNRHVAEIGQKLMDETAVYLANAYKNIMN